MKPGLGKPSRSDRPLWTCPVCERPFANRNQMHACERHTLAYHLAALSPAQRGLYERFVELVEASGPVAIVPTRTRIGFQVRMIFAALSPREAGLDGHVVLARRLEHPGFSRIESLSPRNHVHHFELRTPDDLGGDLVEWLAEAYAVGAQRHLDG